mmetsp:Transcript_13161/g.31669  ORF Transcript_13161/g.31669 Transcript_13161/m.31669 type:complete len:84 (-) Transcript_13161:36-287(-)
MISWLVQGAALAWAAWCAPAAGGLFWLSNVTGVQCSFPPGVTLSTGLGVMISWRAYIKVIGLMGLWRSDRQKFPGEDAEWATL